ncbi:methyltransferase domain-containing protein [Mucilaginibacter sp.]
MIDLSRRTNEAEIMDDFNLPAAELNPLLKGLGNLNAWFGGHRMLIDALKNFPVQAGNHISDWGCGGGDGLKAIAAWAQQQNIPLTFTGVDAASAAITFAQKETAAYPNISYLQSDVMNPELQFKQFDIIISSLFTHHFGDEEWIALVKNMYQSAKRGVIITDLHRHWLPYYAVKFLSRYIIRNKMMEYDGPLSVRRSFTRKDLQQLLAKAGITHYKLQWKWAFRWQLSIYKQL